jgi:hypothetical protein
MTAAPLADLAEARPLPAQLAGRRGPKLARLANLSVPSGRSGSPSASQPAGLGMSGALLKSSAKRQQIVVVCSGGGSGVDRSTVEASIARFRITRVDESLRLHLTSPCGASRCWIGSRPGSTGPTASSPAPSA